jgi:hypothetical protein
MSPSHIKSISHHIVVKNTVCLKLGKVDDSQKRRCKKDAKQASARKNVQAKETKNTVGTMGATTFNDVCGCVITSATPANVMFGLEATCGDSIKFIQLNTHAHTQTPNKGSCVCMC